MPMSESVRRFLSEENILAQLHIQTEDVWPVHASYDTFFRKVLRDENHSLQRHFEEWKRPGRPVHAFDYFGSGSYITDMHSIDSLTGVRLLDDRTAEEKLMAPSHKHIITGNLYAPSVWKRTIPEHMRNLGITKISHATCLAFGPFFHDLDWIEMGNIKQELKGDIVKFDTITYLSVYFPFLQRIYGLLDDEGELFTQIPLIGLTHGFIHTWIAHLKQFNIEAESPSLTVLKLIKHAGAPDRLPVFGFRNLERESLMQIVPDIESAHWLTNTIGSISSDTPIEDVIIRLQRHDGREISQSPYRDTTILRHMIASSLAAL